MGGVARLGGSPRATQRDVRVGTAHRHLLPKQLTDCRSHHLGTCAGLRQHWQIVRVCPGAKQILHALSADEETAVSARRDAGEVRCRRGQMRRGRGVVEALAGVRLTRSRSGSACSALLRRQASFRTEAAHKVHARRPPRRHRSRSSHLPRRMPPLPLSRV